MRLQQLLPPPPLLLLLILLKIRRQFGVMQQHRCS